MNSHILLYRVIWDFCNKQVIVLGWFPHFAIKGDLRFLQQQVTVLRWFPHFSIKGDLRFLQQISHCVTLVPTICYTGLFEISATKKSQCYVVSEVATGMNINIVVSWVMIPSSVVLVYQCFVRIFCCMLQVLIFKNFSKLCGYQHLGKTDCFSFHESLMNKAKCSSKMSVPTYRVMTQKIII
jgi:hypothetical protein